ncbi:MAG: SipW-dependent-type signal peptide-containing protein [Aristaeellaceae bacterium]
MTETKKRKMSAALRRARKRKIRNRRIAMTVALVLVVALVSVGGTIAWLTAKTEAVTNTFTVGDINIDLTETWNADSKDDDDVDNDHWEAKLVPGNTYAKDPKVTVEADSEACWLFVHVVDANNTITGLTGSVVQYSVLTGSDSWTAVPDHAGYYYRQVNATDAAAGVSYNVLTGSTANADGEVKINDDLTKEMMKNITTPTITITAAAVQSANVETLAEAWSYLPTEFTT